jgi:hypothetical protein
MGGAHHDAGLRPARVGCPAGVRWLGLPRRLNLYRSFKPILETRKLPGLQEISLGGSPVGGVLGGERPRERLARQPLAARRGGPCLSEA